MKLTPVVVAVVLALATTTAASSSTFTQRIDAAAARAGFSGEVAVVRNGKLVFARGYGFANRATRSRVTLDTSFNLASIGKTFTGVAVAQLVEAGKLSFGDRIGKYLPHLPKGLRSITVAQLLDHTSGLGDFFADAGYERLRPTLTSLHAYLPLIAGETPQFTPGTRWSYSNSGFVLAGLVIEHVTGRPYDAYVAYHVWKPAGMTHTGCYARTRLPRFAALGYLADGTPNTSTLPPVGTSAGGCYASARDLLAFARALESGRLVTPKLVHEITTPKVPAPGGAYGYGFGIRYGRPGDPPTIWHNGGAPGAGGELDINAKLGVVVVTLSNVGPAPSSAVVDAALNALHVP